jgi:hypothetical protein
MSTSDHPSRARTGDALRWALAPVALLLLTGCGSHPTAHPLPVHEHVTSSWTKLPEGPLSPRHEATGAWINGQFLLVGGSSSIACHPNASCMPPDQHGLRDGASFDPVSGDWRAIAEAPEPVIGQNIAVIGDTMYVLAVDFTEAGASYAFLSYDTADDVWASLPLPPSPDSQLVAAANTVIAIAGSDERGNDVDSVFNPSSGTWQQLPDDPLGQSYDREAVWVTGGLLLTGKDLVASPGSEEPSVVRLALLDTTLTTWTLLDDSEIIGWEPRAVSGHVVFPYTGSADGGEVNNWGRSYPEGGIFDPSDSSWTALPDPPSATGLAGVDLSGSGSDGSGLNVGNRVLVAGHLLDPATGGWLVVPEPPWASLTGASIVANTDTILVWGGAADGDNFADGYMLHF